MLPENEDNPEDRAERREKLLMTSFEHLDPAVPVALDFSVIRDVEIFSQSKPVRTRVLLTATGEGFSKAMP